MDHDKQLNNHTKKASSPLNINDKSSCIFKDDCSQSNNENNQKIKQDTDGFNNIKKKWAEIQSNTPQVNIRDKPSYSTKQDDKNFKNVKNMWQTRITANIEENFKNKISHPVLKKKKSEYLQKFLNCTEDVKK